MTQNTDPLIIDAGLPRTVMPKPRNQVIGKLP